MIKIKIISWNINGYRSAEKSGFVQELIHNFSPDIICLQEIKMNDKVINEYLYSCYYNFANKKGYSGVMVFTKENPLNVQYKMGLDRLDQDGRFLLLEYNRFILINY